MHLWKKNSEKQIVVRAFLADVYRCFVVDCLTQECYPMQKLHASGFFEALIRRSDLFKYQLQSENFHGCRKTFFDPYAFLPTVSAFDQYLFNEGKHRKIYEKLGAHIISIEDVEGTAFCVWAPNAQRVSVVGDFNHWDGHYGLMRTLGSSGLWELFIPQNLANCPYKYEIIGADGHLRLKSDPYANYFEGYPNHASIVVDNTLPFQWNDQAWLKKMEDFRSDALSIYEVHSESWRKMTQSQNRTLNYRELAHELCDYVCDMGFTHVELMPLSEYPFLGSWGYQVTGFFAPTHRYGTPNDLRYFVDQCHQRGIGVILDWVPAHFPKDPFALEFFDGTHLYEHADPRQGMHRDWETLIFNYGRCEVRNFLIGSALYWLDQFHMDGIRIDAVASMLYLDYSRKPDDWIPNRYGGHENIEAIEFLKELNDAIHENFPRAITIAEESTAFGGVTRPTCDHGLGFDMKWNMGWMHDTLSYFSRPPIFRKFHHNQLTFGMLYQYSERFMLALSHDEVVHGKGSLIHKMPGSDMREKSKNLRALYGFMWGWPGKKLLFMGDEFGQSNEWDYERGLDWHLLQYADHWGIQRWVKDLNNLYRREYFLGQLDFDPRGFSWVIVDDQDHSVFAFLRRGQEGECLLVICNLTPIARENYRVGVPYKGHWKEVLNSDAAFYSGDGIGNLGGCVSQEGIFHGYEHHLTLTLPGLSVLYFIFDGLGKFLR
ncbi:MAG: 1,4-alpha-glucan branching protein GlgB [Puniceicoccales bacterium]|jgi:1,4-alpha-glucan branching enzyme|nr:1,4-alpha-glucan branching protein GlgB [Puniceicoccales bacterium]